MKDKDDRIQLILCGLYDGGTAVRENYLEKKTIPATIQHNVSTHAGRNNIWNIITASRYVVDRGVKYRLRII